MGGGSLSREQDRGGRRAPLCLGGTLTFLKLNSKCPPLPGESRVGTWGRNPELRPLSDGPDLGHEQGGHPIEYPGHNSRSPGALPETFPSHPPHAPRGSTAVPTLLPAPGALAPASPGCISGLRSLCCIPSPVRPLCLCLERDLAHQSTSHAPPEGHLLPLPCPWGHVLSPPEPRAPLSTGSFPCRWLSRRSHRRRGQPNSGHPLCTPAWPCWVRSSLQACLKCHCLWRFVGAPQGRQGPQGSQNPPPVASSVTGLL